MQSPFGPVTADAAPLPPPPPDAAIDQATGEAYVKPDGTYWTRQTLLSQWGRTAEMLADFKSEESALRKKVVGVYTTPDKDKGTENVPLGNGWFLKVVKKLNFSLKSKEPDKVSHTDAVVRMLEKLAALGPEYQLSARKLITWKPELSEAEYKALVDTGNPEVIAILSEVVEFSPGSPTVTVVPPKV